MIISVWRRFPVIVQAVLTGIVVATFAGGLGLAALVLFLSVMNHLIRLPAQPTDDLSHIPFVTLASWLLMSAVVAGIAEESSFRGYMQEPIEQRHGPVVAILVTGSLLDSRISRIQRSH